MNPAQYVVAAKIVRALLQVLAGLLLSHGVDLSFSNSDWEVATGAVIGIATVAWSIWGYKKREAKRE